MLSFRGQFYDSSPDPFPLRYYTLIAPFWANVDLYSGGSVFYRYTDDETILSDVEQTIRDAFINDFSPTLVFIATWDRVAPGSYPYTGVSHTLYL